MEFPEHMLPTGGVSVNDGTCDVYILERRRDWQAEGYDIWPLAGTMTADQARAWAARLRYRLGDADRATVVVFDTHPVVLSRVQALKAAEMAEWGADTLTRPQPDPGSVRFTVEPAAGIGREVARRR